MKRFIKVVMALFVGLVALSCESGTLVGGNDYLDVTSNNISGVWRMESYDNGVELAEGSYYYIEFIRKDKTFVSYNNLESMEMLKLTGRYDIEVNAAAIIRGKYYNGKGDWEHRYYVRDLTKNRMVWVATDDESIVKVYVRAELPQEF